MGITLPCQPDPASLALCCAFSVYMLKEASVHRLYIFIVMCNNVVLPL